MKQTKLFQKLHLIRDSSKDKKTDAVWERSLPVEILERIFDQIIDEREACPARLIFTRETLQPTLRSLALVCHVWHDVVSGHLYKEIYISSTKALASLANALTKYPHLPPLVEQFYFSSKIYASGDALNVYTALDAWHANRIYKLCPNLSALFNTRPWKKPLPADDDLAFNALKFDRSRIESLTHLELSLPNKALFGGRMAFSSSITFPALQVLFVGDSWRSYECEDESVGNSPQWFKMPQLRRLCLVRCKVKYRQKLTFPEHSPLLHTLELIDGDYSKVPNMFDPYTSPLLPFAKSLETLTITARGIGKDSPFFGVPRGLLGNFARAERAVHKWSCDFLENLSELCVPFHNYAAQDEVEYPDSLKHLILVSSLEKAFKEDGAVQMAGWTHLLTLFRNRYDYNTTCNLRRVQVMVNDFGAAAKSLESDAHMAGIEFQVGANEIYGFSE
ncbi:hypothetical protein M0805_005229 [Coniferiporia weirii]|nr:hypothetical protein M0805_005229 [Coniferiporia weirii]